MPYNLNSNLFFLHIPKTGGSSIERVLQLDQLKGGYKFKYIKGNQTIQCKSSPQHLTLDVLEDAIENFSQYKHFSIVRNPYDRLVSEFHFSYDCRLENKIMRILKERNVLDFNGFIYYIFNELTEDQRQLLFDNHFVPQVKYTKGLTKVKVFKLEELSKLEKWLQREMKTPNLKIPHDMKSRSRKPFIEYFNNKEILSLVNEYYKQDFKAFKYNLIKL